MAMREGLSEEVTSDLNPQEKVRVAKKRSRWVWVDFKDEWSHAQVPRHIVSPSFSEDGEWGFMRDGERQVWKG